MSPEKRLILAQLRFFCQPENRDEIARALSDGMNWERYLRLCGVHGLDGTVYHVFRKLNRTDVLPGEVIAYLEGKYYQIAARNMYLMDHLRRIVTAFEHAGLSLLPIQGASLVETVYPSLGTRPMNDVDLLVKKEEWAQARQLLQRLGLNSLPGFPNLFSGRGVVLDVHFDPAGLDRIRSRRAAIRIQNDELWAGTVPSATSQGGNILSVADTLLCLTAHLQKHSFSRLIWFLDLALVIRQHKDINGPALWKRAQTFNLIKPLCFVLHTLRSLFGIQLPERIEEKLRSESLNLVERRCLRALLAGEEMERVGDLLLVFSISDPSSRLRLLTETAFPRREIMSQIYPCRSRYAFLWSYPHRASKVLVEASKLLFWLFRA